MSETEIFDGRDDFPALINREFRLLLSLALPYRTRFEGFLNEISADVLDTIRSLISCDEVLEEDFAREVELDMARGRACVGLIPENPVDPIPT